MRAAIGRFPEALLGYGGGVAPLIAHIRCKRLPERARRQLQWLGRGQAEGLG